MAAKGHPTLTYTGAPWSQGGSSRAQPAATRRAPLIEGLMLGLSLLILITYSQTWLTLFFGETVDQSSSSLVRDVYFPAYGAAAIMLAFSLNHSFRAMPRQPFLILILMIVGLSSLWSVAPDQTARRIVAIVFTTLGGFVIGARYRWRQMAEVLAICFAVLAIGSFIAGAFAPSIGRMQSVFLGHGGACGARRTVLATT